MVEGSWPDWVIFIFVEMSLVKYSNLPNFYDFSQKSWEESYGNMTAPNYFESSQIKNILLPTKLGAV
jgi:hypothetical protein